MAWLGFKRAKKQISRIPQQVRQDQQQLLLAQADELVADMKRRAPKGETGNLEKSIRREVDRDDRMTVRVLAGGALTTKAIGARTYDREITVGQGVNTRGAKKQAGGKRVTYDYALAQELGTEDMPANPFFYPSYRQKKKRLKSARAGAARKSIAKAVASS